LLLHELHVAELLFVLQKIYLHVKSTSPLMVASLLRFLCGIMRKISAKFNLECKLNYGKTCPVFRYRRTCSYLA